MRAVLDSNVVLHHVNGTLEPSLAEGDYLVSVVTRIAVLSFPGLSGEDEEVIRAFLATTAVIGIDEGIEAETIQLRKRTRLRMADAIIAATALVSEAQLLTHDAGLLKVPGLKASAPPLRSS